MQHTNLLLGLINHLMSIDDDFPITLAQIAKDNNIEFKTLESVFNIVKLATCYENKTLLELANERAIFHCFTSLDDLLNPKESYRDDRESFSRCY